VSEYQKVVGNALNRPVYQLYEYCLKASMAHYVGPCAIAYYACNYASIVGQSMEKSPTQHVDMYV